MKVILSIRFWREYEFWRKSQKSVVDKINKLIESIKVNPISGIGKPERLKGNSDTWSRRITKGNRLIYLISINEVTLISCKGHYE